MHPRNSTERTKSMTSQAGADHPIEKREIVAETPDLRVRVLTLAPGECRPWHYHNEITDTFFCLEGPMQVETRAPRGTHVLQVGESVAVGPKTAHYVSGVGHGRCRFLIVQGVGTYDHVRVGGS